jgi:glycosyltransferase involved in cell wall biosynthesis
MRKSSSNKKYALIFFGMYSIKFGQFEHYNIAFAEKLLKSEIQPVYIYNKTPEVPEYIVQLTNLGVKFYELNPDIGFMAKVKQIKRLIKKYKPEIVHTHFRGSIIRPVILIAFFMGVPKRFNTFHCKIPNYKFITKLWMKLLHYSCTQLFSVSDAIRDEQIELMDAPEKKIETIRLGVHKKLFENFVLSKEKIKEKYNLPQNALLIANVAFHHHEKGIDILLDAIKIINASLKEKVYLCQIGQELSQVGGAVGTTYTNYLKNKAKELGIEESVIWLGIQNNVPEILSTIDIYVHPSRDEGLGLILLEAFYSKIPVIASKVGGIPEVIDATNGFLVKPGDARVLAEKLEILINSKALRTKKGTAGYKYVNQYYNRDLQVDKLVDLHYLT